ncbi:PilE-like protein [Elusimicrobium minutum Pei191]|uniref:PilE-like protein n=1 Tax=Elusimicrobium minutum (strain Pei191) TaxID=445932 RepID=B2KCW6_ELUMP|nr:prepilin-type N-terminal cleavage/methylation domain-containing protein [Elusimicrobium minutum]ACC98362.1 PilE-like protein [Elusimicrobium minutum Pei191]
MRKHLNNKKAFTLIELLVVVLIIGILAAIALPQYNKAVAKSRMSQLILMNKALTDAQERVFLAMGRYATSVDELDIDVTAGFTLCASDARGQYYTNGKHQIILKENVWGMGEITANSNCAITMRGLTVMAYPPGTETCSSTEKSPCIYCVQLSTTPAGLCVAVGAQKTSQTNSSGSKMHRLN